MGNSNKETAKAKLSKLIERYNNTLRGKDHKNISEETIRTWLNELLAIFGWNVQDTAQVLQERVLSGQQVRKLKEISSTHKKPDYTLMNGTNIKSFFDAKSLDAVSYTHLRGWHRVQEMSVPIVRKKRKIICRNEDYYGKLYKAGYLPFSRRGRCRIYQTSVCRQFWSIEKYRDVYKRQKWNRANLRNGT